MSAVRGRCQGRCFQSQNRLNWHHCRKCECSLAPADKGQQSSILALASLLFVERWSILATLDQGAVITLECVLDLGGDCDLPSEIWRWVACRCHRPMIRQRGKQASTAEAASSSPRSPIRSKITTCRYRNGNYILSSCQQSQRYIVIMESIKVCQVQEDPIPGSREAGEAHQASTSLA